MTQVMLTDATPISGVRRTDDGYLVAEARVARSGIQEYSRREIGLDGDGVVRVFRPEVEVFAADAMASYAHRPVTLEHPDKPVTADTWRQVAIGQTGDEVVRDGSTVRVPLVLMDGAAIDVVDDGLMREMSMGYTATLEMQDGVTPDGESYDAIQRNLRMNHLAVVAAARGGSNLRLGDNSSDNAKENAMSDGEKRTVIVDGLSVETTDAGAQAIEKLQKQIADAAADHEKQVAAKDAEIAKRDARITELEGQVLTDAQIDERVVARAALIDQASKVVGAQVDLEGKIDTDIRRSAIAARLGDAAIDGKSDAYVEAMFDALASGMVAPSKPDPFADAASAGVKTQDSNPWTDSVFRAAGVKKKQEG